MEQKVDPKKRLEELKKRKAEGQIEKEKKQVKISKIDETEFMERHVVDKGAPFIEKLKVRLENIKISCINLATSFKGLDPAIQICIIVPVGIILILLVNRIYSSSRTTSIVCSNTIYSADVKIEEKLKTTFKDNKIYSETRTYTYTVLENSSKTLGQLETEKRDANQKLNENTGISASYKIEDKKLINTITYNYYKIASEVIDDMGMDTKESREKYKERFENFKYKCEE